MKRADGDPFLCPWYTRPSALDDGIIAAAHTAPAAPRPFGDEGLAKQSMVFDTQEFSR